MFYGCVHNRSTTYALLKVMPEIIVASDCSENIIIILFVDLRVAFRKAFDLIDHNVLFNKLLRSGVPEHIIAWSLDYLNDRKQFVKIGDFVSATTAAAAGTLYFNDFYDSYTDINQFGCVFIAKLVNVCMRIIEIIKIPTNKFLSNFSHRICDSNRPYVRFNILRRNNFWNLSYF